MVVYKYFILVVTKRKNEETKSHKRGWWIDQDSSLQREENQETKTAKVTGGK